MPQRNRIKYFAENVYYHAYNRGHNRQEVFLDQQDYATFLYLFKKYLDPTFEVEKITDRGERIKVLPEKLTKDVELHAYCLMPNHFHLLLRQKTIKGMPKLMSRVLSSYTTYFNTKYNKSESIWQGTYKAVPVHSEEQFLQIGRYIHANPSEIVHSKNILDYPYSSLPDYIKSNPPVWLTTGNLLYEFGKNPQKSYLEFVQDYIEMKRDSKEFEETAELLNNLTLE